jgi:hypothetical protein
MTRRIVVDIILAGGLALGGMGTALAGNLWLTGHDADHHCAAQGMQCNHFGVALDFARQGAPEKTKPLLFLDKKNQSGQSLLVQAAGQAEAQAANKVEGPGQEFPFRIVDPSDPSFATLPLLTRDYSAIVIASSRAHYPDGTLGAGNLNSSDTRDSEAINRRSRDIAEFFNAGGGLVYFAGADNRDVYYGSVPIPHSALPVDKPFTLTHADEQIRLTDEDANCCETHNSFKDPGSQKILRVVEKDKQGNSETLVGRTIDIDIANRNLTSPDVHPRKMMEGLMDATTLVITFGFLAFMVERATNGIAVGLGYWPWWQSHIEASPLADEGARACAERNRKVALFGLSAAVAMLATLLANLNLLAHVPAFEHVPQVAGNIISGLIIAAGADPIREFLNMGDRKEEARHREPSPIQVSGTLLVQQAPSGAGGEKDKPPALSIETNQARTGAAAIGNGAAAL